MNLGDRVRLALTDEYVGTITEKFVGGIVWIVWDDGETSRANEDDLMLVTS